jgi:hypothetical protein
VNPRIVALIVEMASIILWMTYVSNDSFGDLLRNSVSFLGGILFGITYLTFLKHVEHVERSN